MNSKQLPHFFVAGLIALTATPAFSQAASNTVTASCVLQNNIPTTILQSSADNQERVIFRWRKEALPAYANPDLLCQEAAQNLQKYLTTNGRYFNRESLLPPITTDLKRNQPTVCLQTAPGECDFLLFTLNPNAASGANPLSEINNVLNKIRGEDLNELPSQNIRNGFLSARFTVNPFAVIFGK